MHIAVMGAGSLGSLLGGLLSGHHEVTLIGREPHMRAIAAAGLRISGRLDRTAHPATTTQWDAATAADVALLTVKAYDTEAAAREMAPTAPPIVVSLQNGLGSCETLSGVLPPSSTVLAGTVTYGALLESDGHVRCTGLGEIALGAPGGGRHPAAEQLAAACSGTLECMADPDMPRRRWEKLATNAAINPVTALSRVRNGAVCDSPLRDIAIRAAAEVVAVANERGIDLDREATIRDVLNVAHATAENESSMARDLRRGRQTEIEAITGAVIERAGETSVPINQTLYSLLVGYERGIATCR